MGCKPSSIRIRVGDHRPAAHRLGVPTSVLGDLRGQPAVAVDLPNQSCRIIEIGLELEDRQHPLFCMEGEPIDHASLAPDRVRDFGRRHPPRYSCKSIRQPLVQGGMPSVHDPLEVAAPPGRGNIEPDLQHAADPPYDLERKGAEQPALDPGNGRGGRSSQTRQILLAQPALNPDRSKQRANLDVVHGQAMVTTPANPAIIG
jgi:hypothetical protein